MRSLFLVGPMGAGKTTIGRQLATELSVPFLDTDREIEARCGADIPWIFDVEGEAGFRARETAMLDELSQLQGIVLATGGGIVMAEPNRIYLQRGFVVYLHAAVDQQVERTSRDRKRPLLQNDDPEAVLRRLFAVRDPLYREVASVIIDTNNRNPRTVCREILAALPPDSSPASDLF
jgi:shikimate kinase